MLKGAAEHDDADYFGDALAQRRPLVMSIIGTRPEAIKMAPVVDAIAARADLRQLVLLTGQHQGLESCFPGSALTGLACPDLARLGFAEQRDTMRRELRPRLAAFAPDLVLVHGDTTSALAGALAATDAGVPVGHVEAGLRSHDPRQPWPEEENRVTIDRLATLLFAPTEVSAANLARESAVWGRVHVTGNSGIDALHRVVGPPPPPLPAVSRRRILVTCHRRENRDESYANVCKALRRLAGEFPVEILYLLHTNPYLQAAARAELGNIPHLRLHDPVPHAEAIALLQSAWALLTDSGGLQEDGAALGVPVIVLRDLTERVEAPDNIRLCGTDPDVIVEQVNDLLMDRTLYARMAAPSLAFGDGRTGPRIADLIHAWLGARPCNRSRGTAVDRHQQDRMP